MSGYSVNWVDCEPSLDNVWSNLAKIDNYNRLDVAMLIVNSYYKLHEGKKTPRDLELELREHNLNIGLIAVEWEKNAQYKKLIDEGKGLIIKRKCMNLYQGDNKMTKDNVVEEHLSKYVIFISCRPREYVIKETLTYSSSMEENLEKLEDAGEFIVLTSNKDEVIIPNEDTKIEQNDINNKIQDGSVKLNIVTVNFEEMLNNAKNEHPNAKLMVRSMLKDGSPILVLVDNNTIVCPIGVNIYHNEKGEKLIRYMPIQ